MKAPFSIVSTLAGISIEVREVQSEKRLPSIIFSFDPFSNVTVCREVQSAKAPHSIVSTLAGISIELNGHSVNAVSPIVFKREFFANTRTDKF